MNGRKVTLTLSVDEQRAFFGEFSEPYGRELRLGVLDKIRDALGDFIEEPVADPEPEQCGGSGEGS